MLRSLTVAVLITLGGGLLMMAHAQTDVSGLGAEQRGEVNIGGVPQ
ncbi:MAG: hypothetical protein IIA44_09885 [Acidobacteria bacterium]|nr:hypothetical protein [Acidobacteriota bacterium]